VAIVAVAKDHRSCHRQIAAGCCLEGVDAEEMAMIHLEDSGKGHSNTIAEEVVQLTCSLEDLHDSLTMLSPPAPRSAKAQPGPGADSPGDPAPENEKQPGKQPTRKPHGQELHCFLQHLQALLGLAFGVENLGYLSVAVKE